MTKISGNAGRTYRWNGPSYIKIGDDVWFTEISNQGNWRVFRNNADDTKNWVTLDTAEPDEHNAPSLCLDSQGVLHVYYARHSASQIVNHGKITVNGSGQVIYTDLDNLYFEHDVSYTQVIRIGEKAALFTRCSAHISVRISEDDMDTWDDPFDFVVNHQSGAIYPLVIQSETEPEIYHMTFSQNPANSNQQYVMYGKLNFDTGDITDLNSTIGNLFSLSSPLATDDFNSVGGISADQRVRPLDVADKQGKIIIVYAKEGDTIPSQYYKAIWNPLTPGWDRSTVKDSLGTTIPTGDQFGTPGDRYYIPGACFDRNGHSYLYVATEASGTSKVKRLTLDTDLETSAVTTILSNSTKRLVRPQAVIGADLVSIQELRSYNDYDDYTVWDQLENG